MLLTALAAAIAVAGPPSTPPKTERMPNLYNPPARCGALHDEAVRRIRTAFKDRPGFQYAVARTVGGCLVPSPVGYHPDYLLPGQADAPQFRPASDKTPPAP